MTLERREKILAAAAGGLVLVLAAWLLWFSGDPRSSTQLRAARDQLTGDVQRKESRLQAAALAAKRLTVWQRRSLPSDEAHARSRYESWLRQLAERLQFTQLNVDSAGGQSRRSASTLFTFTLRGRTNLAKLTEFLHEFYSAGHLHMIRRLDVKPVQNSQDLNVSLTVEAMSLPTADRKEDLTKEPGKLLRLAKLADYTKIIAERNILNPNPTKSPDPEDTTFLTAIVEVDGRPEVWLVDRTAGKHTKLHEGEELSVGKLKGTVKTIGTREMTILHDGRLRRFRYGQNFRSGEDVQGPTPEKAPSKGG